MSERHVKVGVEVPIVPLPFVSTAIEPLCYAERCAGVTFRFDRQSCTACKLFQAYQAGWRDGFLYDRGELE